MEADLSKDRYVFVRRLGEGAQGTVDLCLDTLWNRQVARKTLHSDATNWLDLFQREFEVLADLSHPRLVQVYDFGRTPGGMAWFTRDFIDGRDLVEATDGVTVKELLGLLVDCCRALRPLHAPGLLHWDVKPTNLVFGVGPGASAPGVWPIDFSFTRTAEGISPKRGTVPYMAPEILDGKSVDLRADLYSLGISFFEVCTGRLPFEGSVEEIVKAHLSADRPEVEFRRFHP